MLHVIKEETSKVKGATLQSVYCAGKGCLFTDKPLVRLILLEPLLRNVSELSRTENGSGASISRKDKFEHMGDISTWPLQENKGRLLVGRLS